MPYSPASNCSSAPSPPSKTNNAASHAGVNAYAAILSACRLSRAAEKVGARPLMMNPTTNTPSNPATSRTSSIVIPSPSGMRKVSPKRVVTPMRDKRTNDMSAANATSGTT